MFYFKFIFIAILYTFIIIIIICSLFFFTVSAIFLLHILHFTFMVILEFLPIELFYIEMVEKQVTFVWLLLKASYGNYMKWLWALTEYMFTHFHKGTFIHNQLIILIELKLIYLFSQHSLNIMNISIVKILFNETWKEWLKSIFECVSKVTVEICVDERI